MGRELGPSEHLLYPLGCPPVLNLTKREARPREVVWTGKFTSPILSPEMEANGRCLSQCSHIFLSPEAMMLLPRPFSVLRSLAPSLACPSYPHQYLYPERLLSFLKASENPTSREHVEVERLQNVKAFKFVQVNIIKFNIKDYPPLCPHGQVYFCDRCFA